MTLLGLQAAIASAGTMGTLLKRAGISILVSISLVQGEYVRQETKLDWRHEALPVPAQQEAVAQTSRQAGRSDEQSDSNSGGAIGRMVTGESVSSRVRKFWQGA
jgi:hypothetical protein